ncbi:MAG: Unknown protein [uncultured Campylobacterales bacterium]|uniref:Uncharacterized protein n=1 Tax=uncultured Campylobacterales bacterium TaxID=352960 RepID=A0A6S6T7Q1_9BACT|nr:MAG: Unknown protein [uncultured Campylobacterales bacterium]
MKILLINKHPFISKVFNDFYIDETLEIVSFVEDIKSDYYDLVVIDSGSFNKNLLDELNIEYKTRIYLCSKIDPYRSKFDNTFLKPFLPFRLYSFLSDIEKEFLTEDIEESTPFSGAVLDTEKIDDVKSLLGSYEESGSKEIKTKSKFGFLKKIKFKNPFKKIKTKTRRIHKVIDDFEIDIEIKKVS